MFFCNCNTQNLKNHLMTTRFLTHFILFFRGEHKINQKTRHWTISLSSEIYLQNQLNFNNINMIIPSMVILHTPPDTSEENHHPTPKTRQQILDALQNTTIKITGLNSAFQSWPFKTNIHVDRARSDVRYMLQTWVISRLDTNSGKLTTLMHWT